MKSAKLLLAFWSCIILGSLAVFLYFLVKLLFLIFLTVFFLPYVFASCLLIKTWFTG